MFHINHHYLHDQCYILILVFQDSKHLTYLRYELLLDTPGILWPKFANDEIALNLASMSAIKSEVVPVDEVAIHILNKLDAYYPEILKARYNIDHVNNDDLCETYDAIGKKIGALIRGGEVDYDRVSLAVMNDVKNELVKGITFDRL